MTPTNPPSPRALISSMTLATTLVPNTPTPNITSAKILSDTKDNRIVVIPPKKPVILFIISSMIKSLVNN